MAKIWGRLGMEGICIGAALYTFARMKPVLSLFVLSLSWGQEILLRRVQVRQKIAGEAPRSVSEAPSGIRWVLGGQVLDSTTKEPLSGAYVRVPGSVIGAVTDEKGAFRIPTTLRTPIEVEVSFVGYATRRLTLTPLPEGSPTAPMCEFCYMARR